MASSLFAQKLLPFSLFDPSTPYPKPGLLRLRSGRPLSAAATASAAAGSRRGGRRKKKAVEFAVDVAFSELEEEIFEFMLNSAKPTAFPTRAELVAGGRADLADAVASQGGWVSLGWDPPPEKVGIGTTEVYSDNDADSEASPSGRLIDSADGADGGLIEGILSRIEQERGWSNLSDMKKKQEDPRVDPRDGEASTDRIGANEVTNGTWRTWSLNRAGASDFEAAEINPNDGRRDLNNQNASVGRRIHGVGKRPVVNGVKNDELLSEPMHIRSRLQSLESDLTSALDSLRSSLNNVYLNQFDSEASARELHGLSDDWELQETKVMHARDELRSIRAKIAVLEGKVALEIIETQKILEEKQRRLDAAEAIIGTLRTTNIIWPNRASEVLLVGSFDGWTSQRKMERSAGGIFSLTLRLYPGRYEIKFIVDGVWKLDPLRPVSNNHGHENNILIVD